MFHMLKRRLYFVVAYYFRIWARIKLRRWQPYIIAVTGSAGKTTLLHLIEAQLGSEAHYSHHANSAYGVPFDILGLPQITHSRWQWVSLALKAPLASFKKVYPEKLYVVELDADRPREGRFLATLLRPHITLWVSSLHTHTAQFDHLVRQQKYAKPEEAVAVEYGHILAATREIVVINGDNPLMVAQAKRTKATVKEVRQADLSDYQLSAAQTTFGFAKHRYTIPTVEPKSVYYQVAMVDTLLEFLKKTPDYTYSRFRLPPGRSSIFKGIKNTILIDSTYNNSNLDSLRDVIQMFEDYPADKKWLVLSDMIEQGQDEAREHVKVAGVLDQTHFQHIVLMGPRLRRHTEPVLAHELRIRSEIAVFDGPKEVRDYLLEHLQGGEVVLFKGVRFLEAVIEALLADKKDAEHLVRRDPIWQKRRAEWGL